MTCIIGLIDGDTTWMGADSAASSGWTRIHLKQPEVFRNGEFLIGVTGSPRMAQLMRFAFKPPQHDADKDTLSYLAVDFVDALRKCLAAGGFQKKDDEVETTPYSSSVVAYRGRLFEIESDYQVVEHAEPYVAAGIGQDLARGALWALTQTPALRDKQISPEAAVVIALEAAEHFNNGCAGPNVIESIRWTPAPAAVDDPYNRADDNLVSTKGSSHGE